MSGIGVAGIGMSSFVLASDLSTPLWRPYAGLFLQAGFSVGAIATTLLAWTIPSWRWLNLFGALFSFFLALVSFSWFFDSPQWLLLAGRKGEASATLAAVAFTNKTRPPEFPLADPTALLSNPNRTMLDLLRNVKLRKCAVVLAFVWMVVTLSYYASVLFITEGFTALSLGPSPTATWHLILTGFSWELPGVAVAGLLSERIGRRFTLLGGLLQSGVCFLGAAVVQLHHHGGGGGDGQRAFLVASRFGMSLACAALYIISWESWPVVVRYPGMMLTSSYAGRLGALASPFVCLHLHKYASATTTNDAVIIPLVVCGALLVGAAAVTAVLLPETLNNPVYETIQEAMVAQHYSGSGGSTSGSGTSTARRPRSFTHSWKYMYMLFQQDRSSGGGGGGIVNNTNSSNTSPVVGALARSGSSGMMVGVVVDAGDE